MMTDAARENVKSKDDWAQIEEHIGKDFKQSRLAKLKFSPRDSRKLFITYLKRKILKL